jgi:hypothetical protein
MYKCAVIKVDFKNKKVIGEIPDYTAYTWQCIACHEKYDYDSRSCDNVKSIAINFGQKSYRVCPKCVKQMHNIMENT